MRKIIFADVNKIDFQTTMHKVNVADAIDQVTDENDTYLIDSKNYDASISKNNDIYIPSTLFNLRDENVHVYFDLEQYPFFKKVKEMIANPKGVLRFRRIVNEKIDDRIAAGDLYAFTTILGDPKDIHVKRTKRNVSPYHIIITVNFGEGTMAHLEYTFSGNDRIELDWSGIKTIIEFDSEEMAPIYPKGYTSLPLTYNVESILQTAQQGNDVLFDRLQKWHTLIGGAEE